MRFLYNFGVAICKYHAARPLHSFNKCWKLYSAEICKIVGMFILIAQKKRPDGLTTTQKTPALCNVPFLNKARKTFKKME